MQYGCILGTTTKSEQHMEICLRENASLKLLSSLEKTGYKPQTSIKQAKDGTTCDNEHEVLEPVSKKPVGKKPLMNENARYGYHSTSCDAEYGSYRISIKETTKKIGIPHTPFHALHI